MKTTNIDRPPKHRRLTRKLVEGHTIVNIARQRNVTIVENNVQEDLQQLVSSVTLRFTKFSMACVDQKHQLVTEVLAKVIKKPTISVTIVNVVAAEAGDAAETVDVEYRIRTHTPRSHATIRALGEDEDCASTNCTATPTLEFRRAVENEARKLLLPFFWEGKATVRAFFPLYSADNASIWQCRAGFTCAEFIAPNFGGNTSAYGYERYGGTINESIWQSERGCSCKLGSRLNFYTHVNLNALADTDALGLEAGDKLKFTSPINIVMWDWRYPKDRLAAFLKDEWGKTRHSLGEFEGGLVYLTRMEETTNMLEQYLGKYTNITDSDSTVGYSQVAHPKSEAAYDIYMGYSSFPSEQSFGIDDPDGEGSCGGGTNSFSWQDENQPYHLALSPGNHTINMCDSYGDGWTPANTAAVTIYDTWSQKALSSHTVGSYGSYKQENFVIPAHPATPDVGRISESVFVRELSIQGTCANVGTFLKPSIEGTTEWGVHLVRTGSDGTTSEYKLGSEHVTWSVGSQPTGHQWRATCSGDYHCHEQNLVCGACSRADEDASRAQAPERECASGCANALLGNGVCDAACFVETCDFDFGDCTLPKYSTVLAHSFMLNNYHKGTGLIDAQDNPMGPSLGETSSLAAARRTLSSSSQRHRQLKAGGAGSKKGGDGGSTSSSGGSSGTSGSSSAVLNSGSVLSGGAGSGITFGDGSSSVNGAYLDINPFVDKTEPRHRLLGLKNTIVGGVLIQLKRVKTNACPRDNDFSDLQPFCSSNTEQDEPYGADGAFMEASQLYNPLLLARLGDYYLNDATRAYNAQEMINRVTTMPYGFQYQAAPENSGGKGSSGFHVFLDVNFNEEKIRRVLQYMKDGFYIDQASSELKVSCLCYNGEAQVFMVAIFTFEFSPSGPLKIQPFFTTFAIPSYSGNAGRFRQFCEVCIVVIVFLNLWGESHEMRQFGIRRYFTNFWNAIDIANCVIILILCFWWFDFYNNTLKLFAPRPRYYVYHDLEAFAHPLALNYSTTSGEPEELHEVLDMFHSAEQIAYFFTVYAGLNTVSLLLMALRLLKVLHFQPRIGLVTRTLAAAAQDLSHFVLLFLLVFGGFAAIAYLNYGRSLREFHTFSGSWDTLFRLLLGDVSPYDRILTTANNRSGILFYYVFMFVVFFILLNILLAILVDAYVEVKEDSQKRQAHTIGEDVSDIISDMYHSFIEGKKFGIPHDAHMQKLIHTLSSHDKKVTALRHAEVYSQLTLKHPADRSIEITFPTLCQYLQQECTLNSDQATKLGVAIMTRYGDESRVTTEEELEEDREELADEAEAAAEKRHRAPINSNFELPGVEELRPLSPSLPDESVEVPEHQRRASQPKTTHLHHEQAGVRQRKTRGPL
jgi:hypothetical protein